MKPTKSRFRKFDLLLLAFLGSGLFAQAQENYQYLNRFNLLLTERANSSPDSMRHFGVRPYDLSHFSPSTDFGFIDSSSYYYMAQYKLLKDHLISIEEGDFKLYLDPLGHGAIMRDFMDTTSYRDTVNMIRNTRGVMVQGSVTEKLRFFSCFHENQAYFPTYLKNIADSLGVIPGYGRHKPYGVVGFDYGVSNSWVSWKPLSWMDITLGNGKNFIGHGYRSLLLSDAAFSYPYLRMNLWHSSQKWMYSWVQAGLQSLERLPKGEVPESLFKRKALGYHYLSYCPVSWVEIGVFDAVIWQRWDSTGTQNLPLLAANPIPLINAGILGFNEVQNASVGVNLRLKFNDRFHAYGQFFADDPSAGKTGWQAGVKFYRLGLNGLNLNLEVNQIENGVYGSPYELQNSTHFNQALGHPAGAGLQEYIADLNFRLNRFIFEIRYFNQERSTDPLNLLIPFDEDDLPEATEYKDYLVNQADFSIAYLFNPKSNLRLETSYTIRNDKHDDYKLATAWWSVSLRTSIFNEYFDF